MKLWEAMNALEEGKKIRRIGWDPKEFIKKNGERIIEENGCTIAGTDISVTNDWELYKDKPIYIVITSQLGYEIIDEKLMEDKIVIYGNSPEHHRLAQQIKQFLENRAAV